MEQGWIKLYRELTNKAIWKCSTPQQKVILITLLLMANHEEKEWEWQGKKFKCNPGQFVTSLESIAEECGKGITIQNVRSAIVKFKKYGFLTNESTKTGRLITIENWGVYQDTKDKTNKDTNKEVTKNQQSTNKEVTPNKNDKNDKNDKKYINNKEEVSPIAVYQNNIYPTPGQVEVEGIKQWSNDLGSELVVYAIEIAAKLNARSWRYIERTLINWNSNGIKTLEQAKAYSSNRTKKGGNSYAGDRKNNSEDEGKYDFNRPYTGPSYSEEEINF